MSSLSAAESGRYRRRKIVDKIMTVLAYACTLAAVIPLTALLLYVVVRGLGAWSLGFFTQLPQFYGSGGGVANSIVGSFIVVGIATLIGVPIGIMAGIYLAEYGDNRFGDFVRFVADIMTGIPSIVAGLFIYGLVVLVYGYNGMAGALALAVLLIPVVTRSTEGVVRLVPDDLREASLAMGVPRWKTILRIVLPVATGGILTGVFLGVSRIAGETAPLIFTIFGNSFFNNNPLQGEMSTLSLILYAFAKSPYDQVKEVGWGAALLLLVIVMVFNLGARLIFRSRV